MKLLLIALFLFYGSITLAQSKNENSLADFIRKENYVRLTDTIHLPKSILPYLDIIEHALAAQKYAAPNDVYAKTADIINYPTRIEITVINITGIQVLKHEDDEASKIKDTTINGQFVGLAHISIGSPGGERKLVINKADGNINTYRFQ